MSIPILQAVNLRKSFGKSEALRGLDFEVQKGEVVAVMGPSGSGKSTLLHCLAGILAPDSGQVLLSGSEIQNLNEERRSELRRAQFGFVFQFGQLLPELTALDNVSVPLLLGKVKRKDAEERGRQWLERLGLAGMEDKLPAEMSGGQAQRVAIARAMVTDPQVLFADEPTGSLDSLASENVMNMMLESVRSAGTTVVVITHDARTAAYADRDVIVRDGLISGAFAGGSK
jgi:putative ABC transport system ATP-binding protein